jgi:hypothetical protein
MVEQYLERLYTWESLENTPRGVEFELKNRLDDAAVIGLPTLELDGEPVDPADVTVEDASGEQYQADALTPEAPLELDLAESVQVICDVDRLRLGVHELAVGLLIDGHGEVGFSIADEVTETALLDVDPAEYTVGELEALLDSVTEPTTFERLLERERDGKARKTAIETLEDALAAAEPLADDGAVGAGDEPMDAETVPRASAGTAVGELLGEVLGSPRRVTVYLAAKALGSGTAAEIAARTVLSEETVRSTLASFESEGVAEQRADGTYRVASPLTVLRKRQTRLWNVVRKPL